MDGYALRAADLAGAGPDAGVRLRVVADVAAGAPSPVALTPGTAARIMTGAPLPDGADAVVPVEDTDEPWRDRDRPLPEAVTVWRAVAPGDYVRYPGEDIRAGQTVLEAGHVIRPQEIGVLASLGVERVAVARRPRVGVIATGDELVEPQETPGPSKIRTSNSYQICAQMEAAGGSVTYYGIASDTEAALDAVLKKAMTENDVILLSGGVSMGDFDLVPGVITKNGLEILFDSIAIKPGKPTTFAVGPDVYCFGLPGNPVSTFVQCEILVKPFLYALMGHGHRPVCLQLPLAETYRRKHADREAWIPVGVTEDGTVQPRAYHGSAHINALCGAEGFIVIPTGTAIIEKGTLVRVRPI